MRDLAEYLKQPEVFKQLTTIINLLTHIGVGFIAYNMGMVSGFRACNNNWDKISQKIATRLKKQGIEVVSDSQIDAIRKFSKDTEAELRGRPN